MKLTNAIRGIIVKNALLKSDFIKQHEALIDRRAELCLKIRRAFLSDKLMKEIENVVDKTSGDGEYSEFLSIYSIERSRVRVNIQGQRRELFPSGYISSDLQYYTGHESDVAKGIYPRNYKTLKDEVLIDELFQLEKEQSELDSEFHSLKLSIEALVKSVNTDNQLIQKWPECKELIPVIEKSQSKELAINMSELNTKLGLPTA